MTSFQEPVIASNHRHLKLPPTFETTVVIMSINVCSKLNDLRSKDTIKLDLPETSFNTLVEVLRQLIRDRLELSSNEVDLIAFGKILRDDKSLAFYGIKGTTTIYVIKKRNVSHITCISSEAIESAKGSQSKPEAIDVTRMAGALKMALRSVEFRSMLTRLKNREEREKLMAFTPGLREDPIVLAILQDPDLLALCTEDPKSFAEVVQGHPVLAIAAENLAATFHEDNPDSHFNSMLDQPRYGLDDSDDDEDDEGTVPAPPQPASADVISRMLRQALDNVNSTLQQTRRQQSGQQQPGTSAGSSTTASAGSSTTASAGSSSTTASALSGHSIADGSRYQEPNPAYLPPRVTAANQNQNRNAATVPSNRNVATVLSNRNVATGPSNRNAATVPSGTSLITPSMLQAALMNAVNSTSSSVLPTPASSHQVQTPRPLLPSSPSIPRPPIRDWSSQLSRLRELGITDESYAVQVLEATDGDVEAAVNIILTNQ